LQSYVMLKTQHIASLVTVGPTSPLFQ
jgi:hypothetical protein